jgi:DNA-binding NarL/FixJ family response regulator
VWHSVIASEMDRYGSRVLTEREQRVVELVAQGMTNDEIGAELGLTRFGVANKLKVIYDKLGMWTRLELALWYVSRH